MFSFFKKNILYSTIEIILFKCALNNIVLLLIFFTFLIYLINIILEIKQYEDNYSINKKTRKSIHNSLFKSKNKNISHFLNPFFDIIIIIVANKR